MENDLEILQNIIQDEYNNNKDIQFGDIRITEYNNVPYFYYYDSSIDKETAEIGLFKIYSVLELIVGKMHGDHIVCTTCYLDLANNIYEPIYNLYKEYIKEINYYV